MMLGTGAASSASNPLRSTASLQQSNAAVSPWPGGAPWPARREPTGGLAIARGARQHSAAVLCGPFRLSMANRLVRPSARATPSRSSTHWIGCASRLRPFVFPGRLVLPVAVKQVHSPFEALVASSLQPRLSCAPICARALRNTEKCAKPQRILNSARSPFEHHGHATCHRRPGFLPVVCPDRGPGYESIL